MPFQLPFCVVALTNLAVNSDKLGIGSHFGQLGVLGFVLLYVYVGPCMVWIYHFHLEMNWVYQYSCYETEIAECIDASTSPDFSDKYSKELYLKVQKD